MVVFSSNLNLTMFKMIVLLVCRADSLTKAEVLFDIITFGNKNLKLHAESPRLKLVLRYLVHMSAIMPLEIQLLKNPMSSMYSSRNNSNETVGMMDVELDTEIFNHHEVMEEINMFDEVFEELFT